MVAVPLNGRQVVGVVWDRPGPAPADAAKLKALAGILDTPPMRAPMRRLVDWIAAYTLAPPGEVMAMALRVLGPAPEPGAAGNGRPSRRTHG